MTYKTTLIKNARIVTDGRVFEGDVLIQDERIVKIDDSISVKSADVFVLDAEGKYLLPGLIDDQVHFREPGLTHKANIASESRAAVAGGITSFIEIAFPEAMLITFPKQPSLLIDKKIASTTSSM